MKYRETQKQEESKPISKDEFHRKHPKILRYWLVEISLTSGKSIQFYASAINEFEAYQKADGYLFWLRDKKLRNELEKFRLRP